MLTRRLALPLSVVVLALSGPAWAQPDKEEPAASRKDAAKGHEEPYPDPGMFAPTIGGLTGLFRTVSGDVGGQHTFRIAMHTEAFKSSDFLVRGDSNSRFVLTFAASYTPWRFLEFFANFRSMANNNDRPKEAGRLDQPVILALGDLSFGGKGQYPITPYLSVGGNFSVDLLNAVGGVTFDGGSTGFYIGMLTSFDMGPLTVVPLRFHFNLGWRLDNSKNLAKFTNYPLPSLQVEKFALGLNPSRLEIRFGLEFPLRKWLGSWGLSPIIELAANVATDDADADFDPKRFGKPYGPIAADQFDGKSTLWMTFGLRSNPVRGLNVELASDVGVLSPGYSYGPPVVPYNIIFGLSYAYDPAPPTKIVTRETVKTVVKEAERTPMGKLRGRVINAKTLEPIEGAIVTMPGKDLTGLSTDPDGTFLSYELAAGRHPFMVRHPDFLPAKVEAEVKLGVIVSQDIKLTPAPPKVGRVSGKVTDAKGAAVAATIAISGPESKQVTADAGGTYSVDLKPGKYTLAATADGYMRKEAGVEVTGGAPLTADFSLSVKPKRSLVKITKKEIVISKQVHFATNAATILPDSQQLLDSIVDVLLANPNIKKIEIGGHTDNRGKAEANLALSQARADAVKEYLLKNGVGADRLDAKGYGQTKPKGSNITAGGRACNLRVEFLIKEQ
jgi:OmpA-OmpF porin, OOP family